MNRPTCPRNLALGQERVAFCRRRLADIGEHGGVVRPWILLVALGAGDKRPKGRVMLGGGVAGEGLILSANSDPFQCAFTGIVVDRQEPLRK